MVKRVMFFLFYVCEEDHSSQRTKDNCIYRMVFEIETHETQMPLLINRALPRLSADIHVRNQGREGGWVIIQINR